MNPTIQKLRGFNTEAFEAMMGLTGGKVTTIISQRINNKFSATVPHTPVSLITNMVNGVGINLDSKILVWYTIEMVYYLLYKGHDNTNITIITEEHCDNIKRITDKFEVEYLILPRGEVSDMKFDIILGNPPYQDGSKTGGQNKIYNQITKKALGMLADAGRIGFITPTSILKKSKRTPLNNISGMKKVDFTTDKHFDVGINTCFWVLDKSYYGDVNVVSDTDGYIIPAGDVIYDHSKCADSKFYRLYTTLKSATDKPTQRMFKQNAAAAGTGYNKEADALFTFEMWKLTKDSNTNMEVSVYHKPKPKFYNELKFTISMTKAMDDKCYVVNKRDFDVGHLCAVINTQEEVDNIKSFLFSDYFKEHSRKWKELDGYGYNYALKYLPPFDKSKKWDSASVKEFLESFL